MNLLENLLLTGLSDKGALADNQMAKALYWALFQERKSVTRLELAHLLTGVTNIKIPGPSNGKDESVKDLRFKHLYLKGIRKFPNSNNDFHSYSINFCVENISASTILLGENGVGKSSLFGTLEMLAMHDMNTAKLHGISPDQYLRNTLTPYGESKAFLQTPREFFKYPIVNNSLQCVPAFFTSEWDVRQLEATENIGDFIYSQLGLSDIVTLIKELQRFRIKLKVQFNQYNEYSSAIDHLQIVKLFAAIKLEGDEVTDLIDILKYDYRKNFPPISYKNKNSKVLFDLKNYINCIKKEASALERYDPENNFHKFYTTHISSLDALYSLLEKIYNNGGFEKRAEKRKLLKLLHETKKSQSKLFIKRYEIVKSLNQLNMQYPETTDVLEAIELAHIDVDYFRNEMENGNLFYINSITESKPINYPKTSLQLANLISYLKTEFDRLTEKWLSKAIRPMTGRLMEMYLKDDFLSLRIEYDPSSMGISAILISTDEDTNFETTPREYFNTFRFKMFCTTLKIACACCAKEIYRENWPIVIDDVFDSSDFDNRGRFDKFIQKLVESYRKLVDSAKFPFQLIFFTQDELIGTQLFRGLSKSKERVGIWRIHDYRSFGTEYTEEIPIHIVPPEDQRELNGNQDPNINIATKNLPIVYHLKSFEP